MFKRVESELATGGHTKVWLANVLGESTQNINNWKTRGVPAGKVKAIAQALGVSREYLEGSADKTPQGVAATGAHYRVDARPDDLPRYKVFVDIKDPNIGKLLADHLKTNDDLVHVLCTAWLNAEPFVELSIWQEKISAPWKIMVLQEHIVAITDYSEN